MLISFDDLVLTNECELKVAGDATKHEPPNTPSFDGARDGQLTDSKPRGRSGQRHARGSTPSPSNDSSALILATMLPLLTSYLANAQPMPTAPKTPVRAKPAINPLSPAPDVGTELHACMGDFLRSKGINILASEPVLMELELTPDIVADVPVARLVEVMGTVEGRVRKFQLFCREWNARLVEKRNHIL